jgi:hypothetical protein
MHNDSHNNKFRLKAGGEDIHLKVRTNAIVLKHSMNFYRSFRLI